MRDELGLPRPSSLLPAPTLTDFSALIARLDWCNPPEVGSMRTE
jgi:hypothetical protein